jgi:DeoR/GlpR family transcriptional regulator of sugar metabolism
LGAVPVRPARRRELIAALSRVTLPLDDTGGGGAAFCVVLRYCARMAVVRELLGAERREVILRRLQTEGKVRASQLSEDLGVSLDTVRRDLAELAAAGALRRVHGGALPPASPGPSSFKERLPDDAAAKAAVAAAAVPLVRPGEVVALSGGTTILELARRLPDDLEATVVATNPDIAVALADHPRLTVDVVGGRLHPQARTVTGPEAVDALRAVRPDVCILSACSLHPVAGMTLRHREEAAVVRAMVAGAARLLSLTTATKLGSAGPYPVAALERIDTLVTDADDGELAVYRELGIDVVRA